MAHKLPTGVRSLKRLVESPSFTLAPTAYAPFIKRLWEREAGRFEATDLNNFQFWTLFWKKRPVAITFIPRPPGKTPDLNWYVPEELWGKGFGSVAVYRTGQILLGRLGSFKTAAGTMNPNGLRQIIAAVKLLEIDQREKGKPIQTKVTFIPFGKEWIVDIMVWRIGVQPSRIVS
jgi:hypothetical protein